MASTENVFSQACFGPLLWTDRNLLIFSVTIQLVERFWLFFSVIFWISLCIFSCPVNVFDAKRSSWQNFFTKFTFQNELEFRLKNAWISDFHDERKFRLKNVPIKWHLFHFYELSYCVCLETGAFWFLCLTEWSAFF